jgi:hypothetical protein
MDAERIRLESKYRQGESGTLQGRLANRKLGEAKASPYT